MSILDKANEFIGHPEEIDEGFEVSMRRDAYMQGYKDALNAAAMWIFERTNISYNGGNKIEAFMVRLECATQIVEIFKKYMEE